MFAELAGKIGRPPPPIENAEYRSRQSALMDQLSERDLLIICSPAPAVRSNDVDYPYRNNSDMLYLCGWHDPDSVLVGRNVDGKWRIELFVQPRDVLMEIWNGRRPGIEGAMDKWPIDVAHSIDDLEEILDKYLSNCDNVYSRTKINSKIDSWVNSAISRRDRARQHFGSGPSSIVDPSQMIAELRLIKSSGEIAQMRHACEISSLAHIAAMRNCTPGMGEWQLQALIEGFFRYGGASGIAYPSIVGSGDNATILHYNTNQMECEDGAVVLIDAGGEYSGYASDITRSWPVNGKFTPAQRSIYQLVLDAQVAAIDKCRVGNSYSAPHDAAREVMAKGLIELGIINSNLEDALSEDGELRNWYMHNTGHWIGLDVHDVGIYKPNGEPRLFVEGMVITVEPGLYFGAWRPDVQIADKWAGIGIRIEDDVLITASEPDVLSANCPKEISELEAIIGTLE